MDTLQIPITDYAYLEDVSWEDYESLLAQAGDRPLRFTYDNGRLEIMTLSYEHESPKKSSADSSSSWPSCCTGNADGDNSRSTSPCVNVL